MSGFQEVTSVEEALGEQSYNELGEDQPDSELAQEELEDE